jgi:hypothetical protein
MGDLPISCARSTTNRRGRSGNRRRARRWRSGQAALSSRNWICRCDINWMVPEARSRLAALLQRTLVRSRLRVRRTPTERLPFAKSVKVVASAFAKAVRFIDDTGNQPGTCGVASVRVRPRPLGYPRTLSPPDGDMRVGFLLQRAALNESSSRLRIASLPASNRRALTMICPLRRVRPAAMTMQGGAIPSPLPATNACSKTSCSPEQGARNALPSPSIADVSSSEPPSSRTRDVTCATHPSIELGLPSSRLQEVAAPLRYSDEESERS